MNGLLYQAIQKNDSPRITTELSDSLSVVGNDRSVEFFNVATSTSLYKTRSRYLDRLLFRSAAI